MFHILFVFNILMLLIIQGFHQNFKLFRTASPVWYNFEM